MLHWIRNWKKLRLRLLGIAEWAHIGPFEKIDG
jgi:hypothetical protein